ncbi:transmembrane protein 45B-like [Amblyomma americanum]
MVTFIGHVMPGTFLLILGTWWAFGAWYNYVRCKKRNRRYTCRAWYVMPGMSRRTCLEGLSKIIICSIGIAGEVVTGFEHDRFVHMVNTQHMSMYLFYLLSGLVDVTANCRFPLPPDTDYMTLLLAVSAKGLLFLFHLHGRHHLDAFIHTFLVYTVAAEAACIIVEMNKPRSILASLGRAFFCLLQGTWFWQVGCILHSPSWDVRSHDDMTLATAIFTWHMIGVLAFLAVVGVVALFTCTTCDYNHPLQERNGSHYALVPGLEAKADIDMDSGGKATAHPTPIDYRDGDFFA